MLLALYLTLLAVPVGIGPDYEAAATYSRLRGGRALIVIRDDRVVFERLQNNAKTDYAQTVMSGTKAFGCALVMLAESEGKLTLDERISDTISELKGRETAAAITVRDLLTQTSGLKGGGTPLRGDHHAWIRTHARLLAGWQPGTHFSYGSAHWDLLDAFLQEKLGEDPVDYLEERILQPIGLAWNKWHMDSEGRRVLAFGMTTTPRSWARYGQLVAADGMFEGKRIVPSMGRCFEGSAANPAYGFGWWLNHPLPRDARMTNGFPRTVAKLRIDGKPAILSDGPSDLAMAAGSNDVRLYVVPSRRLVIVRYGSSDDARFSDADLLRPILRGW